MSLHCEDSVGSMALSSIFLVKHLSYAHGKLHIDRTSNLDTVYIFRVFRKIPQCVSLFVCCWPMKVVLSNIHFYEVEIVLNIFK